MLRRLMSRRMMLVILTAWMGTTSAWGEEPKIPVARVGDWAVNMDEVDLAVRESKQELDEKLFDIRMEEVEKRLSVQLLALEAQAKGMTPDKLLDQEVGSKIPKVTDEQVKAFIQQNKDRLEQGGVGMEGQVRRYMEATSREEMEKLYLGALANKYKAEILLKKPEPLMYEVKGPMDTARGPGNAAVTIIEFADFECPYCTRVLESLKQLDAAYPDKIRLVYRHFPLPFHKNAPKAAEASLCAQDQGQFWPYHDALYGTKEKLEVPTLKKLAAEKGLDSGKFDQCLDSGSHQTRVVDDMKEGERLGVTGTPTFFINGRKMVGALPANTMKKVVDEILASKK